jgi:hypothetical protein
LQRSHTDAGTAPRGYADFAGRGGLAQLLVDGADVTFGLLRNIVDARGSQCRNGTLAIFYVALI